MSALRDQADNNNTGCFTAYGSVFGNVDSYGDIVAKGAFKKTISDVMTGQKSWPAMLLQHGDDAAEGRCAVGIWTRMQEDEHGLLLEGKLALKNTRGREAYELLTLKPRPALGLSIGYRCTSSEIHKSGPARRTIKAADLVEVSLVTFPSNTRAVVTSVKAYSEPEPVVVDWKEVARGDYDRLAKEMTRHNRNYN